MLKKLGKKLIKWIKEPPCLYTLKPGNKQHSKCFQMQVSFKLKMFEVKVSWTAICMPFKDQIMLQSIFNLYLIGWRGGFHNKRGITALLLPVAVPLRCQINTLSHTLCMHS